MNPDANPARPRLDAAATANSLRFLLQSSTLDSNASAGETPVLHLKLRLEQQDGNAWLKECFARPPFASLRNPEQALLQGSLSVAELQALKELSKQGFSAHPSLREIEMRETATREMPPRELRLAAVAAYFFAIAAALQHHRACITSQPLAEVRTILIDLAASVADPWSSFLSAAAFVELGG